MGSNPIGIDHYDMIPGLFESEYLDQDRAYYLFRNENSIIYAFFMHIMCIITFIEKVKGRDHKPLSLNPVQKANDPIQDRCRRIGPLYFIKYEKETKIYFSLLSLAIFLNIQKRKKRKEIK